MKSFLTTGNILSLSFFFFVSLFQEIDSLFSFAANGDLAKLTPLFPTYKAVVEDLRRGLTFWDSVRKKAREEEEKEEERKGRRSKER